MMSREDLVVMVQNPDGSLIVEHADGTRTTSFLLVTPPNGEAPDCMSQSKENGHIKDACDKGKEMSRRSASHKLNERILDKIDQLEFPQDAVSEKGKREEGGESTTERVVLVEKEGCASVVMYPDRHAAHVLLADGTIITGNSQAEYEVWLAVNILFMSRFFQ
ncbi:hypothetical protein GOODEAATRI_005641 [Goodea atripinnis]|uniref:Uncharacterized protein n=1 Tax=Goodea atripinnis TaxID=208336 RepID=A0ABV0N250_9TELE